MIKQNFTIEEKQMKRLREYCEKNDMKMSAVVRMGLNLFFIRESRKNKPVK